MGGGQGAREGGRGREGWVGAPLCEILNTPLGMVLCLVTLSDL